MHKIWLNKNERVFCFLWVLMRDFTQHTCHSDCQISFVSRNIPHHQNRYLNKLRNQLSRREKTKVNVDGLNFYRIFVSYSDVQPRAIYWVPNKQPSPGGFLFVAVLTFYQQNFSNFSGQNIDIFVNEIILTGLCEFWIWVTGKTQHRKKCVHTWVYFVKCGEKTYTGSLNLCWLIYERGFFTHNFK